MIKVIFRRSNREEIELGVVDNVKSAWALIKEFLIIKEFKSYYSRLWVEENKRIKIDVGSWSEFFYFEPIDMSVEDLWNIVLEFGEDSTIEGDDNLE